MANDPRLGGRVRTRTNAAVRARTNHPACPLCGHPINRNLNRTGRRHPLSSVIDEWFPRSKGGDPHDPDNCTELHSLCNAIKSDHWPITPDLAQQCRQAVERQHQPITVNPW